MPVMLKLLIIFQAKMWSGYQMCRVIMIINIINIVSRVSGEMEWGTCSWLSICNNDIRHRGGTAQISAGN